jgi:GTPase involved in cell partitioning and DNA repair
MLRLGKIPPEISEKAHNEVVEAHRAVFLDQKQLLTFVLQTAHTQNAELSEQYKIIIQAVLSQNAQMLDRFMSMVGKLVDYEISRQELTPGATNPAERVDELKSGVEEQDWMKLFSKSVDDATQKEDAELSAQIRNGTLQPDL